MTAGYTVREQIAALEACLAAMGPRRTGEPMARLTPAEQLAALRETIGQPHQPGVPGDLTGSALDPHAAPSPHCWACAGRGEVIVNRNHDAHPETAQWKPTKTWGAIDCPVCHGTGLREGAGLCGDCDEPIPDADDALCVACANLPRCRRCALRLDADARDGDTCCDCTRQDRIDLEINLGEL
jgi:hypothetical protein